jgi:hypothetical protein
MTELLSPASTLAEFEISLEKAELLGRQLLGQNLAELLPDLADVSVGDFVVDTDESGFEQL